MFEEFVEHNVTIVTLDGDRIDGVVLEVSENFIKLATKNDIYILRTDYVGYLKTARTYKVEQQPSQNEFSMEMPKPEDLSGPQLIRQTKRSRR